MSSYSNPVPETKSDDVVGDKVEPEIRVETKSDDKNVRQKPVKEPSVTDLLQQIFNDDEEKEEQSGSVSAEKADSNSTAPSRPNIFEQFQEVIKPIENFLQTNPVTQFFSGQSTNNAANDEQPTIMNQFTTQFNQLQQQLSTFANNIVNVFLPTTASPGKVDPEVFTEATHEASQEADKETSQQEASQEEVQQDESNEVKYESSEDREIPEDPVKLEKPKDEEKKQDVEPVKV